MIDMVLVFGDVHLPLFDAEALALAWKVAELVQPRYLIQNGDLIDAYALSRFDKDPRKAEITLAVESKYAHAFSRRARTLCDNFFVTCGNHDFRAERYLYKVPELASMHPTVREILGLEPGEFIPYRKWLTIGKCNFVHDMGPAGVNALRQTLEASGANIVFGHTHQGGVIYDGNLAGERHVAMNSGWLGNPDHADYATPRARARWQHGVGLVEIERDTGACWCHFVPFVNGRAQVPGYGKVTL